MDAVSAPLAFALAAGLLTVTPGLDTALVLRTAAVEGPRRAMQAAIGIVLGCFTWAAVASVGLGALLATSAFAYDVLRVVGALYILWLGGRMIAAALRPAPAHVETPEAPTPGRSWAVRGYLTNLLNPKVGVFYVTFLPLFVPPHVNVTGFSMLLAGIHVAESLLWFWMLTTLVRPLASWIRRGGVTRALDGVTGGMLLAFGVGLFLARR